MCLCVLRQFTVPKRSVILCQRCQPSDDFGCVKDDIVSVDTFCGKLGVSLRRRRRAVYMIIKLQQHNWLFRNQLWCGLLDQNFWLAISWLFKWMKLLWKYHPTSWRICSVKRGSLYKNACGCGFWELFKVKLVWSTFEVWLNGKKRL